MNTEAAMELQMRLAKEALAMLVIHPTFDVQLYRESIMEIGEAWELPADATLEALALIEHERLAIQKAGEGGGVQHILPEEELPMHATGTETLDNVWDLFETSLRTESTKGRTVLYNMARTLEETQNLLDWIEKTEEESAPSGSARKEAGLEFSKDIEKKIGVISSEGNRKEAAPVSSKEEVKKAKSCSLMQEVTAFLTSRYRFRFNVLTEETEVADVANITNIENNLPDAHLRYTKVDERWMNTLSMEAIETGIDCWDRDIQRFVRSRRISEYHPFTAYFEQLSEWDGTDRVSALARRVSDNPVWVNGFHRWMLGLSAQWMQFHPDTNNANRANSINRANSVAPLLVSSRQGLGKSTFCRLLMPDALKAYYTESYDLSSPASAEAKLAAYGLINLDEFDKLSASKMPLLKNLMQASALNIRKAYKRSASALPRIASFIGTSNREDLLVDRTGSRRFLCVSLEHAIDCVTPVEYEQLYAQLKAELLSGERSWFNKEEEQAIQQHNALFYKHIPEEEVFRLCFRFATQEDHPQEVLTLSATQLFERMKAAHPSVMRGMTAYSLSRILPRLGERVHTAKGNVYRVVAC